MGQYRIKSLMHNNCYKLLTGYFTLTMQVHLEVVQNYYVGVSSLPTFVLCHSSLVQGTRSATV